MTRIRMLTQAEMTDDQRRVYEATVAGRRGRAPAPVIAWLESPELAILVIARYWTAQYEWFAHKQEALKAGLGPALIDDVARRRQPHFENGDERLVYEFSMNLIENHSVHDDLYRATVDALGERGVVELVGLLGYYTLISMTLNTFEIGVSNGAPAELEP
jgi:4-carboxymuconolactone decarboxylase